MSTQDSDVDAMGGDAAAGQPWRYTKEMHYKMYCEYIANHVENEERASFYRIAGMNGRGDNSEIFGLFASRARLAAHILRVARQEYDLEERKHAFLLNAVCLYETAKTVIKEKHLLRFEQVRGEIEEYLAKNP